MGYQDFDGKGDSKSHEKLKALRLDDFANITGRERSLPLKGLSVLDVGCNEGFFCIEAIRQGARRVVGLDKSPKFIAAAKERCPEATFIEGTWWNIPDEKFDLILFLSAIHYEPRQKELLAFLRSRLKPGGTLILECGVARDQRGRRWYAAPRADGVKLYPTEELLIRDLLSGYATRFIGPSVRQAGDPIPRYIYHCSPKQNTAILIAAKGGAGKTCLAGDFQSRGIPVYDTDGMFNRILRDQNYSWNPLQNLFKSEFGAGEVNCGLMAVRAVDCGLHEVVAEAIALECPLDTELFVLEGDALRHEKIRLSLISKLAAKNVNVWTMVPERHIPVAEQDIVSMLPTKNE